MSADALSDLLKTVRLTGAAFFEIAANDPWVIESPARNVMLPKILPGADHLIAYHVVTMGRCFARTSDGDTIPVEAGEVVVFTHGDTHVMSSGPGMQSGPTSAAMVDTMTSGPLPFLINFAEGVEPTTKLVCGYLACDARPFNPLMDNLPRVIKGGDPADGDNGWLGQFIRFAVAESADKRAGSEGVLSKLSELMFIEVIRRHLNSLPPGQAGWLAGLRDPFVGKTLSLMHGAPARSWTIEDLAKEAGVSRSVLAERFTQLIGIPPIQYLAKWRMQIAAERLTAGQSNVATVAAEIGYESEAAFSRAFKKSMGVPPSAWRRDRLHA